MEQKREREKREQQFKEDIIADVKGDFETRREERRQFEAQWQLNSNFLLGNQYCAINVRGDVDDCGRDFFWQEREVYNHVAPITETRLAKLNKVRPKMSIRPATGDNDDVKTATAATKILSSAYHRLSMDELLTKGTEWSEVTGSVFYKLSWNKCAGMKVGEVKGSPVYEGDVRVDVCPPYEIFPDKLSSETISACRSIIHAKALPLSEIKRIWGVDVESEHVETVGLDSVSVVGGLGLSSAVPRQSRTRRDDHAIVIERYTRPTPDKPNGELAIVAGKHLLHYGELPFFCGEDGMVDLPFVKQDAYAHPGCFYGISVIERIIPIQRAYNAVKNRKHEFLNRISMGVLAVEDGSVDTENLENEGLSPGKILIYRQGSTPPMLMNPGNVPSDFNQEEDRLLNEFIMVSGVSEVLRNSSVPSNVTSGVALQLLLEQDDTRISASAERIRAAVKSMAKIILRLYRQFATTPRLSRCFGEAGDVELVRWQANSIGSDDVVFDTENEISDSIAARKSFVFDILKTGLLHDENGRLSDNMRHRVLDMLGLGSWEQARNVQRLHSLRAQRENNLLLGYKPTLQGEAQLKQLAVKEIDDHAEHIAEHTQFMLSSDYQRAIERNPKLDELMNTHLREHKQKKEQAQKNGGINGN